MEAIKAQLTRVFNNNFMFSTPPVRSGFYLPVLIVAGVFILIAVVILIFARGEIRKFLRGYVAPFMATGIIAGLHLFARYQSLPWLSVRFVLFLDIVILVIWLFGLAFWLTNYIPNYQKEKANRERFEKYLPKKNRKSKV